MIIIINIITILLYYYYYIISILSLLLLLLLFKDTARPETGGRKHKSKTTSPCVRTPSPPTKSLDFRGFECETTRIV